jgi:hypothetical protein
MWEPYTLLTLQQMQAARVEIRLHLDYWAERLALCHGLNTFTVEPTLYEADSGVDYRQYQFVGHLLSHSLDDADPDPELRRFLQENEEAPSPYRVVPHLLQGPLRRLLVEAFAWPAILLFQPEQWLPYSTNTRRWPLSRAFGAWRELFAKQRKPDPCARLPAAQRALEQHNRRKARAARTEYQRLLAIARELWPKVLALGSSGRPGRPAYKQRLCRLLADAGLQVKRRQLDQLMIDLKQMLPPAPGKDCKISDRSVGGHCSRSRHGGISSRTERE